MCILPMVIYRPTGSKLTDKPGSVMDSHSSAINVTIYLLRSTRPLRGPRISEVLFDLAPRGVYHTIFVTKNMVGSYPTVSPLPIEIGGFLSVALSIGSHRPGVTWLTALRSPDFPPESMIPATAWSTWRRSVT